MDGELKEPDVAEEANWFAVRCVFHVAHNEGGGPQDLAPGEHAYEERITLWQASSADEAIELSDREAEEYAARAGCEYTGLAQSYWLEEEPSQGAVTFSLVRRSLLDPDGYVDAFFDTGHEYEESADD
jgi:hypothetical protein